MAGQRYSLICSVQAVQYLVVEPNITWSRQGGGTPLNFSSGSSLWLSFNILRTSQSGLYTCRATVNIFDIVSAMAEKRATVAVESKCETASLFSACCKNIIHQALR